MNTAKWGVPFSFLAASQVWACATCGGGQAFNPAVLLIGSGFILLPMGLVGLVAYRVWKDSKNRDRSS